MNALLRNRNFIPLSSSFTLLSLLLATVLPFPPTSRTSLPIYLPVSVCISLTHPISFCLSHMACHLCDKWTSFFSGNSPMMDFSLLLCVCAVFLVFPPFCFPAEVEFVCFAESKHGVFLCFFYFTSPANSCYSAMQTDKKKKP